METDKDHIHYMIETPPTVALSDVVRTMKSYTTFHIWKLHETLLSKSIYGYFICSIGNVSETTLANYIENQG